MNTTTDRNQDVKERLQAEQTLNQAISSLLTALLDPAATIANISDIILSYARSFTGSEHGYVSSIDPQTGSNISHTLTSMLDNECQLDEVNKRVVFPLGPDGSYGALWGHSLNTRVAFYTNSPAAHSSSKGTPEGHIPIHNFISVPAIAGDELVGQIALANANRDYTDRDLEVIQSLAQLFALAVHRKRTEETMLRLAAVVETSAEELVQQQMEREISALEHLSVPRSSTITAQAYGLGPLSETHPQVFTELVEQFEALIEKGLEEKMYKVWHNLSEELRGMAGRLGYLKCGPRDVIEIYIMALRKKKQPGVILRAQAVNEEGRLLVLELMGHLVSYYRNRAQNTNRWQGDRQKMSSEDRNE